MTATQPRRWSWFFFLAGDNSLASALGADASAALTASVPQDVSIDVLLDTADGASVTRSEGGQVVEARSWPDLNTGNSEVLLRFLADGHKATPAVRRGLVIGGHGSGWEGVATEPARAAPVARLRPQPRHWLPSLRRSEGPRREGVHGLVAPDDGVGDALDTVELRVALGGEPQVPRFAFLGFDACFMGAWEIVSLLAERAEVIVASPGPLPASGWPYLAVLPLLSDATINVDDIASAFVWEYGAQTGLTGSPLLALRSASMPALDSGIDALATALVAALPGAHGPLVRARACARIYQNDRDDFFPTMVDIGHLVHALEGTMGGDVAAACRAVRTALNSATVALWPGSPSDAKLAGLSIYLPRKEECIRAEYARLPGAARWAAFLNAWHAAPGWEDTEGAVEIRTGG